MLSCRSVRRYTDASKHKRAHVYASDGLPPKVVPDASNGVDVLLTRSTLWLTHSVHKMKRTNHTLGVIGLGLGLGITHSTCQPFSRVGGKLPSRGRRVHFGNNGRWGNFLTSYRATFSSYIGPSAATGGLAGLDGAELETA